MRKICKYFAIILTVALIVPQPVGVQATLTQEEQIESLKRKEAEKAEMAETETETERESEGETEPGAERESEGETESGTERESERTTKPEAGSSRLLVAVDPCYQGPGADVTSEEPLGPETDEMGPRASTGGTGRISGQEGYELNLQVALRLEKELESRGYDVVLTRRTNDVDLSYRERCEAANEADADIMVRLYAGCNENEDAYGAYVYCPSSENPYLKEVYESSLNLADSIEDAYCEATGISNKGIWMADMIAGMNWCEMPVAQLEMGNLYNEYNDAYMAKDENRDTMAKGIADGIDDYFGR